jgi:hypothetical protein
VINARRVNEAIEVGLASRERGVFVCESGRIGCNATLALSVGQYEALRTGFERFVLAPGHEVRDLDRVAEDHGRYLVVAQESARLGDALDSTTSER